MPISAVHRLYAPGRRSGGAACRRCSRRPADARGDPARAAEAAQSQRIPPHLPRIEAVVHPLVAADRAAFLRRTQRPISLLLDIPLLFETGADASMDAIACGHGPAALQRARVLARPGMTEALFQTILAQQMPDGEKRARATHLIETLGLAAVGPACRRSDRLHPGNPCMREIVLDTETTGFEPTEGHRIVEIGAVELFNHMPTGRTFHQYINPQRPMPKEAFEVHGLGDDFLRDKPVFEAIGQAFLDFIGDAPLVIHNAAFDMKFLNAELGWAGLPTLPANGRSIR